MHRSENASLSAHSLHHRRSVNIPNALALCCSDRRLVIDLAFECFCSAGVFGRLDFVRWGGLQPSLPNCQGLCPPFPYLTMLFALLSILHANDYCFSGRPKSFSKSTTALPALQLRSSQMVHSPSQTSPVSSSLRMAILSKF